MRARVTVFVVVPELVVVASDFVRDAIVSAALVVPSKTPQNVRNLFIFRINDIRDGKERRKVRMVVRCLARVLKPQHAWYRVLVFTKIFRVCA